MHFYVSWVAQDPEYQLYDADCSLLISPNHQPKSWSVRQFFRLPRRLMLDSGSYYLMRRPGARFSARDVLDRQLRLLGDSWRCLDATICHLDQPIVGRDVQETDSAVELTIANAYELRAYIESRRDLDSMRERVKFLGVIQGTTPESIRFCAHELQALGFFDCYGLGSCAHLMDANEVIKRVRTVREEIGSHPLHVFGVTNLTVMRNLVAIGVGSVDSSRPIMAAINCTVFYGSPMKGYTIKGTLRRAASYIARAKPCDCPICQTHKGDLLRIGSKRFTNYRAVHNYLRLKQELKECLADSGES